MQGYNDLMLMMVRTASTRVAGCALHPCMVGATDATSGQTYYSCARSAWACSAIFDANTLKTSSARGASLTVHSHHRILTMRSDDDDDDDARIG